MADRWLIDHIAAGGVDREAAVDMVDRVFTATRELLALGNSISVPGVGRLVAPKKAAWVPSSAKRQAVEQRKVALRYPGIVESGEPYDVRSNLGGKP